MSRFNTGNPIGSGSPLDLDDNAKNMDLALNSTDETFQDRLQRSRLTYAGMETRFAASQQSRQDRFNTFIASSGYQFIGDYGPGIQFTEYNQLVRDANGEFWRLSGQVELPYVTTGAGIPEDDALVPAGDAVLRQDLANPAKGAAMVAFRSRGFEFAVPRTIESKLNDTLNNSKDFGSVGDGVLDEARVLNDAVSESPALELGRGTHNVDSQPVVVSVDHALLLGTPGQSYFKNDTQNQAMVDVGDPASLVRTMMPTVGFIGFKDQPAPAGSGTQNDNHPLSFRATTLPQAFFLRYENCGLGFGFKRGDQDTVGGRGTHSGLLIGASFWNPANMVVEHMDDDTTGCVSVGIVARTVDTGGSHLVRLNGRNQTAIGYSVYPETTNDSTGTGVSFQGGHGHNMSAFNVTRAAQGIQVQNTGNADKWSYAANFIIRNPRDFGLRQTDSQGMAVDAIIYSAGEDVKRGLGAYVLGSSAFSRYNLTVDGTRAAAVGASHNSFECSSSIVDILARDMRNGANGVLISEASRNLMGRVNTEKLKDDGLLSGSARSIRLDGVGHILDVMSDGAIISGTQHILNVVNRSTESVSIFASDSIITVTTKGTVLVTGSNNVIKINTPLGLSVSGNFNEFSGRAGSITDTGTRNNLEGVNGRRLARRFFSQTTNASGVCVVTHNFGAANIAFVSAPSAAPYLVDVTGNSDNSTTLLVRKASGSPAASVSGLVIDLLLIGR